MRKRIIQQDSQGTSPDDEQDWLDVEDLVQVELTSEDAEYPIEPALIMSAGSGWRAQHPGKQTIRLLFDRPQRGSVVLNCFSRMMSESGHRNSRCTGLPALGHLPER